MGNPCARAHSMVSLTCGTTSAHILALREAEGRGISCKELAQDEPSGKSALVRNSMCRFTTPLALKSLCPSHGGTAAHLKNSCLHT